MKKELTESGKKVMEAKGEEERTKAIERRKEKIGEVSRYAKAKYQDVKRSTIEQVRREHPELFDGKGGFTGRAVTSNGAEGGREPSGQGRGQGPVLEGRLCCRREHTRDDQGLPLDHQGWQGRGERRRSVHVREGDAGGVRWATTQEKIERSVASWKGNLGCPRAEPPDNLQMASRILQGGGWSQPTKRHRPSEPRKELNWRPVGYSRSCRRRPGQRRAIL
ncbi:MAG: hypothetical protein JRN11_07985 [Nitrososphaerota archaeon]|jgi:hypothetical protein|nr:hypothetical protein [Nitrososphaerota archaeon]MDG6951563.1 hypothetical protein [Nitrososphaerota archaeon]MDG6968488.1 hypothetical protein [Nitrososphaerota archaeon]MDG6987506.1 hypothetical protein [Nitrososphaerota archaeon]MDG6990148.1 hypothetical protein [Nitrososphaerota archaeon]